MLFRSNDTHFLGYNMGQWLLSELRNNTPNFNLTQHLIQGKLNSILFFSLVEFALVRLELVVLIKLYDSIFIYDVF